MLLLSNGHRHNGYYIMVEINLIVLPVVQIALYILVDCKYNRNIKWLILLCAIIEGLIIAHISWMQDMAAYDQVCGTGKPIVLAVAIMIPVFVHGIYLILKKTFF